MGQGSSSTAATQHNDAGSGDIPTTPSTAETTTTTRHYGEGRESNRRGRSRSRSRSFSPTGTGKNVDRELFCALIEKHQQHIAALNAPGRGFETLSAPLRVGRALHIVETAADGMLAILPWVQGDSTGAMLQRVIHGQIQVCTIPISALIDIRKTAALGNVDTRSVASTVQAFFNEVNPRFCVRFSRLPRRSVTFTSVAYTGDDAATDMTQAQLAFISSWERVFVSVCFRQNLHRCVAWLTVLCDPRFSQLLLDAQLHEVYSYVAIQRRLMMGDGAESLRAMMRVCAVDTSEAVVQRARRMGERAGGGAQPFAHFSANLTNRAHSVVTSDRARAAEFSDIDRRILVNYQTYEERVLLEAQATIGAG